MIIILECRNPPIRPGWFRSEVGGRPYLRVWCCWFAITYWTGEQSEFGNALRDSEWKSK